MGACLAAAALIAVCAPGPRRLAAQNAEREWQASSDGERRVEIVRRYRSLLAERPDDGPMLDRLVAESGAIGGPSALLEDYARLRAQQPDRLAWALLHGHLLRRLDRLDEAEEAYLAAHALQPDSLAALRGLARVALARRDDAGPVAWLRLALEAATSTTDRADILRSLLEYAVEARQWAEAANHAEALIALEPRNPDALQELADIYLRNRRWQDARGVLDRIVLLTATDTRRRAIALRDLGDAWQEEGDLDAAVQTWERALALVSPGHWLARDIRPRIVSARRQAGALDAWIQQQQQRAASRSPEEVLLLAEVLVEAGRAGEAESTLAAATRRLPAHQDLRLALVRILEERGALDEAIEHLGQLVRRQPRDSGLVFRHADLLRRAEREDEAVATLLALAGRSERAPDLLLEVADRLVRLQRMDEAQRLHERVTEVAPADPESWAALGRFHFARGRRSTAERIWERMRTTFPAEAEGWGRLAEVQRDHGLLEEAVLAATEALRLEPDDELRQQALAELLEEVQRLPQALQLWQPLRTAGSTVQVRQRARRAVLRLEQGLGRLQDRLPVWESAWRDSGALEDGWLWAEGLMELSRWPQAEVAWREVLVRWPGDGDTLAALAAMLEEQGRWEEALGVLEALLEANPARSRETLHRLASLSARLQDDEAALRHARRAVDLHPDDATARARLADVHRTLGDPASAREVLREAVALNPRALDRRMELVDLHLALHQPRAAETEVREVMRLSRDEPTLLLAGRRAIRLARVSGDLATLWPVLETALQDHQRAPAALKLMMELAEVQWLALEQGPAADVETHRQALVQRLVRPLNLALDSDDLLVRQRALQTATRLQDPALATALARTLLDADPLVRRQAALALVPVADARVADLIMRALDRGDPGLADLLLLALGGAAELPSVQAWLHARVEAPATPRSQRALALLGLARARSAERPAAQAHPSPWLSDTDTRVVQAAIVHLSGDRSPDDGTVRALALLLQQGSPREAAAAAWGLAFHASAEGVLGRCTLSAAPPLQSACAAAWLHVGRRPDPAAWPPAWMWWRDGEAEVDLQALLDAWVSLPALTEAPAWWPEREAVVRAALAWAADHGGDALRTALGGEAEAAGQVPAALARLLPPDLRGDMDAVWGRTLLVLRPALVPWALHGGETLQALTVATLARLHEVSPDDTLQRTLTALLGVHAGPEAAPALRVLACHPDVHPAGEVVPHLASAHWEVRAAASLALASGTRDQPGVDLLASLATDDPHGLVRLSARLALLRLQPEVHLADWTAAWPDMPLTQRRLVAGWLTDPLLATLRALAQADADPAVRAAAKTGACPGLR
jgi:tetratricopeptide (TPR) repeat protein